jgi:excisionase family DNA binding protein
MSTTNEDATTLLTVPELAEYLGIGRNRAYDLLRNGIIKGFRIGCTWKVSKAAVIEYILIESRLV